MVSFVYCPARNKVEVNIVGEQRCQFYANVMSERIRGREAGQGKQNTQSFLAQRIFGEYGENGERERERGEKREKRRERCG